MAEVDEVVQALEEQGLEIEDRQRLPDDRGWTIWVKNIDGNINVYDTGSCLAQGRDKAVLEAALGDHAGPAKRKRARPSVAAPATAVTRPSTALKEVFVVYGHDAVARDALEAMLRRWGVEPLILDQLPSEGGTIIEKLEKYQADVGFAVVLATPDDEGHRMNEPSEKKARARQNVVLELGMVLNKLGRARVAILLKDAATMERPSDIDGLIYLSFKDNVDEVKLTLAKEMNAQGYDIPLSRL